MREMFTSYLGKLVENTKDLLAHPSAEQATQDKETAASLQGKLATPQEKRERPTLPALEKSKKRRIPFIALALMVLFTSFCILSLFELRPVALADKLTHFDNSPSAASPSPVSVASPLDQTVADIMNAFPVGTSADCSKNSYHTMGGADFCWETDGFKWGVRDITCIYNGKYTNRSQPPTVDYQGTVSMPTDTHQNQDTCTNNSQCVSDNRSLQDGSTDSSGNTLYHAQTGGDNILCANNACTTSQTGNTQICGDPSVGGGRDYDRFACETIENDSVRWETNQKHVGVPGANAGGAEAFDIGKSPLEPKTHKTTFDKRVNKYLDWVSKHQVGRQSWGWVSAGTAVNPKAYDPDGALYLPVVGMFGKGFEWGSTYNDTQPGPSCTDNTWSCATSNGIDPNIVIYGWDSNLTQNKDKKYEVALPDRNLPIPTFLVVCDAISGGYAFPCSDFSSTSNSSQSMPFITPGDKTKSLDNGDVNPKVISKDWFSGNYDTSADNSTFTASSPMLSPEPGHLEYTYKNDTIKQQGIVDLFPIMMGIGSLFIAPALVLIGYQLLWASWTLGRANAIEMFGRVILSFGAIAVSYELASMLIDLTNTFNMGLVQFHQEWPYQDVGIDKQITSFTLVNQGENDPLSFRGIAVPMSRWGCIANDFVALLANKFWTDLAGFVPFFGGFSKFIGNIANMVDVAKDMGEFVVLLMSIALCTQVFVRIILLNYYILTAPVAFGCWGLPEGVGQKVVSSWAKGFCSLLFSQTIQLFVLATFPLILPAMPYIPDDRFGILNEVFKALPRVVVLIATLKVPTVMGTQAAKAMAQAGTVVAGAVAAAGAAAMNTV